MLRVLHVVTHMNRGGLETMIMNYYRNLDRDQVQFDFLVHRQYRAAYDDEIEALGGIIYRLPTLNPFDRKYRKKLSDFFETHHYNIIHVHQDCMSSVILKEAKKHGVPVRIAHSHNSNQDKNIKYIIKLFYKRFIPKYATDLFACGKEAGDWMFNGARFRIINNAIDAKKFVYDPVLRKEMRGRLNITDNVLLIGHVGRFSQTKNHSFLIDILDHLSKETNARLLLIGDGELRKMIEEKVESRHLSDKVVFAGIQTDIASYMQAMDVFVFPSIYEGLPVTLIEAQAAGLPCVVSKTVPMECKKTDLVSFVSLDTPITKWTESIMQASTLSRKNTYADIVSNGFDIEENARWLENFYKERAINL